jgi:hypothetical protein
MDQELPAQLLPAVHHLTFSIFNVGIPNLIMWGVVVVLFFVGGWLRLFRLFEGPRGDQLSGEPREGRPE